MKKLTDEEYLDYQRLKSLESLSTTYNLEDDIDFPIKNSVALLALAGANPMFSCCGFDYHGQPQHKKHQYGEPYIMLQNDDPTRLVISKIYGTQLPYGWKITRRGTIMLALTSSNNPHWDSPEIIHYSEMMVIALNDLEHYLWDRLKDSLLDEVILEDTNKTHHKNLKYWQYPPKNPWVITLDSLTI